jgi:hypothetical protein
METNDLDSLLGSPVGECGRCHRKVWAPDQVGQEDRMTQPDGYPCGGRIESLRVGGSS